MFAFLDQAHMNVTILSAPSLSGSVVNTTAKGNNRPHRHHYYFSRFVNLLFVAVVLLLSLAHVVAILRRRQRQRQRQRQQQRQQQQQQQQQLPIHQQKQQRPTSEPDSDVHPDPQAQPRPRSRVSRGWAAVEAVWQNCMYLYNLPSWLYGPESVCDALWTVGYTALLVFFSIWKTTMGGGTDNLPNQMGVMAFSQLPLIIILIQKNNPISALTGITYQKLNYLHRASSRACLLLSWLHCILWFKPVLHAGHVFHAYILWGYMALGGYTLLWITSIRLVRRVAYEFFLVAHIIFTLMFLIGALFHWYRLGYWPSIAIWIVDRMIRGIRTLWINGRGSPKGYLGECRIEMLGHDLLRVTARREGFKWKAGQHAFIFAPSVSRSLHEAHPFSIANVPSAVHPEAIFLVRIHSGFTRRLADALKSEVSTSIPIYLEGPYGTSHSLAENSTVLLVAGGTGVTFTSSFFLSLLLHHTVSSPLRHLHLVWHVRHRADTAWLAPILNQAAEVLPEGVNVQVDIYVTKTQESDEPAPFEGLPERLVEGVAPSYFARLQVDTPGIETPWADTPRAPLSRIPSYHQVPQIDADEPEGRAEVNQEHEAEHEHEHDSEDESEESERTLREGEQHLLAKAGSAASASDEIVECGLTRRAWRIVKFHRGRADLEQVVRDDVGAAEGQMHVSVCGPTMLMRSLRSAVRNVSRPEAILAGQQSIEYFEETLGA